MNSQDPYNSPQSEADRLRRPYESRLAPFFCWIESYWRVHLALIAFAATLVIADWMFVIYRYNVWSAANPLEANGGMAAFGEALYHFFHACMLMIPTLWLILLMSRFKTVYTAYARLLFWLSLTFPALVAVCSVRPKWFLDPLFVRLVVSPFILVAMAFSRGLARFDLAKRLTFWALAMEAAAFAGVVALLYTGILWR